MTESKSYPDEDEDEESLEKLTFQSNRALRQGQFCLGRHERDVQSLDSFLHTKGYSGPPAVASHPPCVPSGDPSTHTVL